MASCRELLAPDESLDSNAQLAIAGVVVGGTAIQVTPSGPLSLLPGDTVTLRGPRELSRFETVFTSSDSSIATVTEEGLLTALRPGSTQILVTLRSDPRATTAVHLQVGTRGASLIEIDSLAVADTVGIAKPTLRTDGVAGGLLAQLRFERGDAVRLEVLIDTTVACSSVLSRTASSPLPLGSERAGCAFDTASFDSISGAALFRNGEVDVTARLIDSRSRVLATSAPRTLRLANRDTIATWVVAESRATDKAGRVWLGGSLRIGAFPVIYSGRDNTETVTFRYLTPSGTTLTAVDSVAPFVTTIEASALAGLIDDSVKVVVTSTVTGGGEGLSSVLTGAGYDAVPPPPGRLSEQEWVGARVNFSSFFQPDSVADRGVGGIRVRFFAGRSTLTFDDILKTGTPVQRGADLPESLAGNYRLAYEVCDALFNCVPRGGFDFGVDHKAPTIHQINFPRHVIAPVDDLRLQVSDERSGLSQRPLEVVVLSYRPSVVSGSICGAGLDDLVLPGKLVSGICTAEPSGTVLSVPRDQEGYYIYRITAVDRAGNRTDTIERVVLIDHEAPVITRLGLPASFVPGTEAMLSLEATDNLDLASTDFSLVFGSADAAVNLPLSLPLPIGTPFTGSLTPTFEGSARIPFVRTLTTIGNSGRATMLVDAAQVRVVDAAGLVAISSEPIPATMFGGNRSITDPFPTVNSVQLTSAAMTLCTLDCATTGTKRTTLSVRIVGNAGLSAFSRLLWFIRAPDGAVTQLSSTQNFSVIETGTQRTYTYSLPYTPAVGLSGRYSLFAVALNSGGNALMVPDTVIELVAR